MAAAYYALTKEQVLPFVRDTSSIPVSDLKAAVRGRVYTRDEPSFPHVSRLFNGAMQTPACVVVCPLDAKDICEVLKFCNNHGLSPSVKSGGYGTHGLAVEGDVIIDMQDMKDIDLSQENVPFEGSVLAMDRDAPRRPHELSEEEIAALRAYPASTIDVYSPPEILKRKRSGNDSDEASDHQQGMPPPALAPPPVSDGARPSVSSEGTTAAASSPMTRAGTSGSGSRTESSDGGRRPPPLSSTGEGVRRIRPRYHEPDVAPEASEVFLAGPNPFVSADGHEGSPSATPTTGMTTDTGETASGSPLSSAPDDSKDSAPSVATRSPPAPPRGPFSYPSSSRVTDTYSLPPLDPSDASSSRGGASYPLHPIEPPAPFVYVTFGAGATQRIIDAYCTAHPLSGTTAIGTPIDVPYYVPFAAHPVGSTVMLLGGFGFQTRLRGLSVDALVEVEMVLPDGRVVVVNESENTDLWWAVRGAGTAFGIATRYKAKAYPVPVVYAGNLVYEFHRATAASLIRHFRDCIKAAPRELYANVILTAGPRKNGALVVIQICWLGPKEGGIPFLNAIMSWSGGQCLLNEVNEKTFANQQDSVAKVLKAAAGRKWFLRADTVRSLTDELVHQSVERFADTPDGCAWLFELAGGAMIDFEGSVIPKSIRHASFNIVAFHQWKIEDSDARCVDSAEEWMQDEVNKVSAGGPLPSFFERMELVSRTIGMYGQDNWDRLVELKRKYDPEGVMRHNFWPLDENGTPIGLQAVGSASVDEERSKGKPAAASNDKGKGRADQRHGNHLMDKFLLP